MAYSMLTLAWLGRKNPLDGNGGRIRCHLPLAPVLNIKRFSHLIGRKIKSELIKTLEWQQQSKPELRCYMVPNLRTRPKSLSINKLCGSHFSSWRMARSISSDRVFHPKPQTQAQATPTPLLTTHRHPLKKD